LPKLRSGSYDGKGHVALTAALPSLRAIDTPLKRAFEKIDAQVTAWIEQAQLAPKT
jgi:hypothetical protein